MVSEVNIPDGAKREPRAEECEWPLEAGIGKAMEFSESPPRKEYSPADIFVSAL